MIHNKINYKDVEFKVAINEYINKWYICTKREYRGSIYYRSDLELSVGMYSGKYKKAMYFHSKEDAEKALHDMDFNKLKLFIDAYNKADDVYSLEELEI